MIEQVIFSYDISYASGRNLFLENVRNYMASGWRVVSMVSSEGKSSMYQCSSDSTPYVFVVFEREIIDVSDKTNIE